MDISKVRLLESYINSSSNIVFFGGAGVSTASGIKDFRSEDGLYHQKFDYPPEEILSHSFFLEHPDYFYRFYRENLNCSGVLPNVCHRYLARLEKNKNVTVITQNIDGLHQLAGSKNVLELHGSIYRNHCTSCGKSYPKEAVFGAKGLPICSCGNLIKPDVVLYEEALDEEVIRASIEAIREVDLLMVVGTSLMVYPASSFVNYFGGKWLVVINRDATFLDSRADLTINDDIKEVFGWLMKKI